MSCELPREFCFGCGSAGAGGGAEVAFGVSLVICL